MFVFQQYSLIQDLQIPRSRWSSYIVINIREKEVDPHLGPVLWRGSHGEYMKLSK